MQTAGSWSVGGRYCYTYERSREREREGKSVWEETHAFEVIRVVVRNWADGI